MNRAKEPVIEVGIVFEPRIEFEFLSPYMFSGKQYSGREAATISDGKILWNGEFYDSLQFEPVSVSEEGFILHDVTIGINFHWERKEDQRFEGSLKIIVENGKLTAINRIGVESYMLSVISSEMNATASKDFLKAHAVISRSWLLAQIEKNREIKNSQKKYSAFEERGEELIKWYDREDHVNFDVCADDHCQRYQGVTRANTENVRKVIEETWGEVLTYNNKICDARFSKCCGGVVEEFKYAWEDADHPYLVAILDKDQTLPIPDLTDEKEAEKWILSSPEAYCNTTDKGVLSQVLNNYDQETTNFYRWVVEYEQDYLSDLIKRRSGIDFGDIIDLQPVARGTSGRMWKLRIVGTKKRLTIGKELEIRRTLSESHLYSSAFVVGKEGEIQKGANKVPAKFILRGAGWGHGVGLCQIGAAVMGEKGVAYEKILLHYFVGAQIEKRY